MRDKKKPHTNILYIQGTKLNKIAENMQQLWIYGAANTLLTYYCK